MVPLSARHGAAARSLRSPRATSFALRPAGSTHTPLRRYLASWLYAWREYTRACYLARRMRALMVRAAYQRAWRRERRDGRWWVDGNINSAPRHRQKRKPKKSGVRDEGVCLHRASPRSGLRKKESNSDNISRQRIMGSGFDCKHSS